jgi:multidrug resistance protein, MATE family
MNSEEKNMTFQDFKTEAREITHLGLPIAIASLSGMVISLTNTWMLGKISTTDVAAAGAANPMFWIIALVGMSSLSMTSPLIAAANEQNDVVEMKKILNASWVIALLFALGELALLIPIGLNFNHLGYEPEVATKAQSYLWTMLPALFPLMLQVNAVHFADGLSLTRVGMVISLSSIVVTTFLNWLFIFGNWGFPKLGIEGIGIVFTVSEFIQFAVMWLYLNRAAVFKPIMAVVVSASEVKNKMKDYAQLALPVGLQAAAEFFAFSLGALWIGQMGKYPQAAHQISITLSASTWVVFMAIGAAGSIRVAQGYGSGDKILIKTTGKTAIWLAIALVLVPVLAFVFIPETIVRFFIDDPSVIPIAASLTFVSGFFQVSDALQSVGASLLKGLEDTKIPTIGTIVAYWVLGMPVGYYLAFVQNWGALGVWIGFLVALSVQAAWYVFRFFQLANRIMPKENLNGVN